MLSLAIIGFIWELIYSPTQGLINNLFEDPTHGHLIDLLGNPKLNLWAILVAAGWRHAGYVMIIYLAGLKAVDPSLREAAAIDGAGEWHAFRTVVFPALKPINIVVAVITVIEALRAFDIVYIINNGRNGLELLSVLVTDNIIGEASRVGYGSAIAVILLTISIIPIIDLRRERLPGRSADDHGDGRRAAPSVAASRSGLPRVLLHVFLIVLAVIWLVPVVWAVFTSFRSYGDTATHGYVSLAAQAEPHELPHRVDQRGAAALLLQLADHRGPCDRHHPAARLVGRVRSLPVQLLVQRAAAHLLPGGEPAAAAGDPHAALQPVPAAPAAHVAQRQRPLLRLVSSG